MYYLFAKVINNLMLTTCWESEKRSVARWYIIMLNRLSDPSPPQE